MERTNPDLNPVFDPSEMKKIFCEQNILNHSMVRRERSVRTQANRGLIS